MLQKIQITVKKTNHQDKQFQNNAGLAKPFIYFKHLVKTKKWRSSLDQSHFEF